MYSTEAEEWEASISKGAIHVQGCEVPDQANECTNSAQTPHQLGQRHLDRELLRKNRKELKRNARSSMTHTQIIEYSGIKKKHAALQGCVRLSGVSSLPLQTTSEVLGFSCFSLFLDLEKSFLGAWHS